jgi:putative ABC transport system permease protein
VKMLRRKLLRELWQLRAQAAAVVLVAGLGVAIDLGLSSSYQGLARSCAEFYENQRMAQTWAELPRLPQARLEPILASWPGEWHARSVLPLLVDLPGHSEPTNGRLMGQRQDAGLCRPKVVRGRGLSRNSRGEALINESFARAHGLVPGSKVEIQVQGRRLSLEICGWINAPDQIFSMRPGALVPDPARFALIAMDPKAIARSLGLGHSVNQLLTRSDQWSPEQQARELRRELEKLGVLSVVPLAEQPSNALFQQEVEQGQKLSGTVTFIFLLVAALILNLLVTRLVEQQRMTLGTLKAMGVPSSHLLLHVLSFGLVLGLLGGLAGTALGYGLSSLLLRLYDYYFEMPLQAFRPGLPALSKGILSSVFMAGLGSWRAARACMALQPAEAMRPAPPVHGRRFFAERWPALWSRLDSLSRLALRELGRQRGRFATGALSTAFGAALIVLAFSLQDSMQALLETQYRAIDDSDATLSLSREVASSARSELVEIDSVRRVEGILVGPAILRNGRREKAVSLTGLSSSARLLSPRNERGERIALPEEGLLIDSELAKILNLKVGDQVQVELRAWHKNSFQAPIAALTEGALGLSVYLKRAQLARWAGVGDLVNVFKLSPRQPRPGIK